MQFFGEYSDIAIAVLAALLLLQWIFVFSTRSRVSSLHRLMRGLLTGPGGEDLEIKLTRSLEESRRALEIGEELDRKLGEVSAQLRGCVQRVGLVRYDAYGDVSGAQSFSVALLDGEGNGVVISGLLGRNDGRCYGKSITRGQAEQMLSHEEEQAVQRALRGETGPAELQTTAAEKRGRKLLGRA
jgi:hypothetical protein